MQLLRDIRITVFRIAFHVIIKQHLFLLKKPRALWSRFTTQFFKFQKSTRCQCNLSCMESSNLIGIIIPSPKIWPISVNVTVLTSVTSTFKSHSENKHDLCTWQPIKSFMQIMESVVYLKPSRLLRVKNQVL